MGRGNRDAGGGTAGAGTAFRGQGALSMAEFTSDPAEQTVIQAAEGLAGRDGFMFQEALLGSLEDKLSKRDAFSAIDRLQHSDPPLLHETVTDQGKFFSLAGRDQYLLDRSVDPSVRRHLDGYGNRNQQEVMRIVAGLLADGRESVSPSDIMKAALEGGRISQRDAVRALNQMLGRPGRGESGLEYPVLVAEMVPGRAGTNGYQVPVPANIRPATDDDLQRSKYHQRVGEVLYAARARDMEERVSRAKAACINDAERAVVDTLSQGLLFDHEISRQGKGIGVIFQASASAENSQEDIASAVRSLTERGVIEKIPRRVRSGGTRKMVTQQDTWTLPDHALEPSRGASDHPALEVNATPNERAVLAYLSNRSGDGYVPLSRLRETFGSIQHSLDRDKPTPALRSLVSRGIVEMDGDRVRLSPAGAGLPEGVFESRSQINKNSSGVAEYLRDNPRDRETQYKVQETLSTGVSLEKLLGNMPDVLEALPPERTEKILSGRNKTQLADFIKSNQEDLQRFPSLRGALQRVISSGS